MLGIYIGGRLIPWYGLMLVTGIAAASLLGCLLVRHFRLDGNDLLILAGYGLGGGMLGAKLFSLLGLLGQIDWSRVFEWDYLRALLQGGYVFYGGLIGAVAAVLLAGKLHKISTLDYAEAVVPCIPLAHGFGRIGCHLAGCCYGIAYDGPGSIVYHAPAFAPLEVGLFPVQLTEAACNFLLAAVLFVLVWRRGRSGAGLLLYLAGYASVRFGLEFLRADAERGGFLFFSTSQWISLGVLLAVGCFGYWGAVKRRA